jgi:formylmethanofuran dehydrogenase subunit B
MPDQLPATPPPTFACPFCGLGCDDLSPSGDAADRTLDSHGCALAEQSFHTALSAPPLGPRIAGRSAPLDQALRAIAWYLGRARLPLFGGLSGDLTDQRGVMRLAERTGGAVDHRNGAALMSNLSVLESGGWLATSLGEVRNRADLLVLVGGDLTARFPRLLERLQGKGGRLHTEAPLNLVRIAADNTPDVDIPVPSGRLREFVGVLRARLAGRMLAMDAFPEAEELARHLAAARYPVIAYSASLLFDSEPHPDLTIRALAMLVRDLNVKGRAALLPLGGADGETTAQQVSAWHTGFGIRQSFHAGVSQYRPRNGGGGRLLASGGADLLVWVSTLGAEPPPATEVPTLVLGHPAMVLDRVPEVFIPLAVPGVHRNGAVHRGDGIALLPLTAIAVTDLPASGPVFARLLELLAEERPAC